MLKSLLFAATALATGSAALPAGAEESIEVIHSWVSEGEVAALNTIKADLAKKGVAWQDSAVGGAAGANASQALRARLVAGNPPGAMQFIGFEAVTWSEEGALRDLSDLAAKDKWEAALPPALLAFVRPDGKWTTTPVNMHRNNWVFANAAAFKKAGVEIPKTWDELIASGRKFRDAGIVPLAMSDEGWQVGQVFDTLVVDLYGADFYRKAIVDLDDVTLRSPQMIAVFNKLREVRSLADENLSGRDWAVATNMVASGQAAMQVMGDWAKGEFTGKGLKAGTDFLCFATPSDNPSYIFNSDAFGMFTNSKPELERAQDALAETAMDASVQSKFSMIKGSIPARLDADTSQFDECGKKAVADRETAIKQDSLVGSLTNGFGNAPQYSTVFGDVIAKFFVTSNMTAEDAVAQLADGINNAR